MDMERYHKILLLKKKLKIWCHVCKLKLCTAWHWEKKYS